jgi:hypothetical protein
MKELNEMSTDELKVAAYNLGREIHNNTQVVQIINRLIDERERTAAGLPLRPEEHKKEE